MFPFSFSYTLNPTNIEDLYLIAGIARPSNRRKVCARVERTKDTTHESHSLYGQLPAQQRLKFRNWFFLSTVPFPS